jgi:hypothetical protein
MADPHPDHTILHSPQSGCQACCAFPLWQAVRLGQKIAFTDEVVPPGWSPCPSTLKHPTLKEMVDFARAWRDTYPDRDLTVEEE